MTILTAPNLLILDKTILVSKTEQEQSTIFFTAVEICTGGGATPLPPDNLTFIYNSSHQIIQATGSHTNVFFTYNSDGQPYIVYDAIRNITKTIIYINKIYSSFVIS